MADVSIFQNFPPTLRIGAYDWRVEILPDLKDEEGTDLAGTCEERGFIIQINSAIDINPFPLAAVETVIHEITHAVFFASHLAKGDTEERVCLSVGAIWTQILRDNPKLVAWFGWALKECQAT